MIDLVLAAVCWWRGWGIKSLIPFGVAVLSGTIIAIISASLSIQLPIGLMLILNIIIWIVQIWMIFNPPEKITPIVKE